MVMWKILYWVILLYVDCQRNELVIIFSIQLGTVQLKGNVALTRYSVLEPRELDTPYFCSDGHDASKG